MRRKIYMHLLYNNIFGIADKIKEQHKSNTRNKRRK